MATPRQRPIPPWVIVAFVSCLFLVVAGRVLLVTDASGAGWTWVFVTAAVVVVIATAALARSRRER